MLIVWSGYNGFEDDEGELIGDQDELGNMKRFGGLELSLARWVGEENNIFLSTFVRF